MIFGKNINRYYFKYVHLFLIGIIALLFVDYIQMLLPENYGNLIDAIKNSMTLRDTGVLPNDGLLLTKELVIRIVSNVILIALGMFVGRFLWRIAILNLGVNVETDLRKRMFLQMETLSQDYFYTHKTGAQMALYTNDLMSINNCFTDGIIMLIDAIFLGGMAVYKMIRLDLVLTIVASIPLLIIGLCGGIIGKTIDKKFDARQESYERLSDFTQENFSGISVIKAFVKEKLELQEFIKNNKEFSKTNISFTKLIIGMNVFFTALVSSIVVIIVGYGTHLIVTTKGSIDAFTAGDLIMFISYFGLLTWPALALANLINLVSQGRTSLRRINELLEYPVMVKDSDDVIKNVQLEGNIEFKNLTFAYPGSQTKVLKDVSFTIHKNEKIGIIGKTGCGKTTIVDVLTRVYNVDEGMVFIDGIDIMKLPIQKVRQLIAYVPQDNFLFNTSILENIAFSRQKMDTIDAIKYATFASVDDNIQEFPDKYETIIGERGVTLSGGQKQRISMARAMAKDAQILILDDSVSAVDTKTEASILHTLQEEFRNKTIILIAHRVSTIESMDKIILVDDGKIIACGKHSDLYKTVPMYRDIVDLQKLEDGDE